MHFTRRHLLAAGAAFPFALRSLAQHTTGARWVLLGTDKGSGIFRALWNPATGELAHPELAAATPRPDFFALHPTLPVLYTVNSVGGGKGAISSFRVNDISADLKFLNQVSSHGDGPCFVSVDATGQALFAANYSGGSFTALPLAADGSILDRGTWLDCRLDPACGTQGPIKDRQDASHLHCAVIAPGNNFVLVCDLGNDAIEVLPIHPGTTPLLGTAQRFAARPGSGPRHVAFHPNGKWFYCIHEIDCTIDLFDWSAHATKASVHWREGSTRSTLPDGVELEGNTACELIVSPDGRFVYTCTRGTDDITVFAADREGMLTVQQRVACGGPTPRYIAFDPTRRWLVACNQGSAKHPAGNIAVFAHEPSTGRLSETPKTFFADTPMFIQWI